MKRFLAAMLVAGLLDAHPACAQSLAIEVPSGAPLKDIPVEIKVVVSGYRCEELTMKVNQGKLEPLGNCRYRYTGTQVGYGKFQVYARRKGRLALIDSDRVAFVNIRGSDHQKTDVSIKPVEFVITE